LPRLAVAMTPHRAADVCDAATRALLEERFDVAWAGPQLDAAKLARLVAGAEVVLTSWGTPHLDAALWADGTGPAVVAHAAGSVKKLIDPAVLDRVTVFSAAGRIAWSVGEYCLAAILTLTRQLHRFDTAMRAGEWKPGYLRGHEIRGRAVGILGASSTARALITMLRPFGCDVRVYDPYLDADRAAALGVRTVALEEALACPIVSVHVPNVPETVGMVSRGLVEALPDGAVVVNSSRGPAVDQDALLEHVLAGRISAALDVYDTEPPTLPSEVLAAQNLLLSPHVAGDTEEGHLALTAHVVTDVLAFLDRGERGPSVVDPAAWAIAA
jgi:phosphoglycerate dehydrogenase-like enzyme